MARTLALALVAAALLLAAAPTARAGAVFETREAVPSSELDYIFEFNATQTFPAGSIQRAQGGAGAFFRTSAIPLAIFTLNKCAAVSVHIHPNAAETLFVLEGKIKIHQFRGEEDNATVRSTTIEKGSAGYISQGAIHTVENIHDGESKFLQIFDHPQAGAVFVGPSLAALPANLINSAFSADVLSGQTGNGGIIAIRGCSGY